MENLPLYVSLVFGCTVLLAVLLFYKSTNRSAAFLIIISIWILMQSALSLSGFYTLPNAVPPRFPFIIFLPLIILLALLTIRGGKRFTDILDLKALTLFHIVRIPVELVLFWLFTHHAVPQLMTFEGRNFDIFSGLSAPFVCYFGFVKKGLGKSTLIVWNLVCLSLVLNVAINGVLSAPTPFQRFAFDQPNIAVQYFPFVLLPALIVPLVLLAHITSLRQLLSVKKEVMQ